jgi:hypothetical protein
MAEEAAKELDRFKNLAASWHSAVVHSHITVLTAARALRARPLLARCLQLATVLLVAWMLLGDNLKATWGPIDDHGIMGILGDNERLSLATLATELRWHPEVGDPSFVSKRYRPAYFTLRYLETFVWGDSVKLWYGARLILFAASLWMFWQVLCPWLGAIGSAAAVLWLLTCRFWPDIWCRLGPAETYAVFGTALCLRGAASLRQALRTGRDLPRLGVGAVVLGASIAVGSKENMLILVPACWLLAGWCCWARRPSPTLLAGTGLVTLWGLWIAWVVMAGIRQDAFDIYRESVDSASGARALGLLAVQLTTKSRLLPVVLALAALPVVYLVARRSERFRGLRPQARTYSILMAALVALFVSQFLFYRGKMPGNTRYDFPGVLALPLLWISLGCLVLCFLRVWRRAWFRAARLTMLGVLVSLTCSTGFRHFQQAATANREITAAFSSQVREVVENTRRSPGVPVVLFSRGADDYELICAWQQYLHRYRVDNPLYLFLESASPATNLGALDCCLFQRLSSLSKQGDRGFRPLGQLDRRRPFLAVCLGGARGPQDGGPSGVDWSDQFRQTVPALYRSRSWLVSDFPVGKEQP